MIAAWFFDLAVTPMKIVRLTAENNEIVMKIAAIIQRPRASNGLND
jgi:hypothetical protein